MAIIRWEPLTPRPWFRSPLFDGDDIFSFPEDNHQMNVYETDDSIVVEVAVPGIAEKDIEISMEGRNVNIRGEMEQVDEEKEKGKQYYKKMEKHSFNYTATLPKPVDSDKAEAVCKNGMLTITFPKVSDAKPKRIAIKSVK